MKNVITFSLAFLFSMGLFGQGVAINESGDLPDSSSVLDVSSTSKGLLIPRMTMAERAAISNPATGLIIFQTDGYPGIYYNSGTPGVPEWNLMIVLNHLNWEEDTTNHILVPKNLSDRVGIGTSSPIALLHVADSAVVFTANFYQTESPPPITDPGIRMMWYPAKAAFRSGYTGISDGSKDSIGYYSFAEGFDTKASGDYSFAAGYESNAIGESSFALGRTTFAFSTYAIALGNYTHAENYGSVAIGHYALATGKFAYSLGNLTEAQSYNSLVTGRYNVVAGDPENWISSDPLFVVGNGSSSNDPSNALTVLKDGRTGINTESPAEELHVKGTNTKIRVEGTTSPLALEFYNGNTFGSSFGYSIDNDYLFLYHNGNVVVKNGRLGINTVSPLAKLHVADSAVIFTGIYDPTPGEIPISGPGSRFMWLPDRAALRAGRVQNMEWDNDSIGDYSVALGLNSDASGYCSFAAGFEAKAEASHAVALGDASATGQDASALNGVASGYRSFAGAWGEAAGDYSVAFSDCYAVGNYSTALGYNTFANSYASLNIGRYNVLSGGQTTWAPGDPVFTIGNGTSSARSNAFTVLKNGKTGINTASPSEMLHVVGLPGYATKVRIEGTTSPLALEFYNGTTYGAGIGYSLTSNYIFFYEDGNVIVQNGNLGVGQTSIGSGRKIDVAGGAYCTGTNWVNYSDKNKKANIVQVSGSWILDQLCKLEISSWNYIGEPEEVRHIGPMAQDFHALFDVGQDNTSISTVDADGVSLAAIKELYKENQDLKKEVNELSKRLEKLENSER